jgi:hypothetical protein
MAYDDSRLRGESAFRVEPEYRADPDQTYGGSTSTYPPGSFSYSPSGVGERTDAVQSRGYGRANLEDVFDDPAHGEPGRDRFGVHVAWELVLLLGAATVGYLLYQANRSAVTGDGLRGLMVSAAALGLLVLGAGLSLRAASPNLAVGPIAFAASVFFAQHASGGLLVTALKTALLALLVGAVIALVTVGLHVPAWAASLAAGLAVVVWAQQHHEVLRLPPGAYQPTPQAPLWFGGFALLALVGAFLGSIRSVRRAVGRFRPVSDPAHRRGGTAAGASVLALLGSSGLAAASGVLTTLHAGQVAPADTAPFILIALGLGGALLAGTSAFGRRGGLFGTVLAAALLTLVTRYLEVTDRRVSSLAIGAAAIGVGLLVTRLVEAFGRPRQTFEQDAEPWRAEPLAPPVQGDTGGRSGGRPTSWTSPLPASSADDRWGTDDSWSSR